MTQKIIIIETCRECTHCGCKLITIKDIWCTKMKKYIKNAEIPEDCPLEELQDYV
jgi:hypothetical protein